MSDRKDSSRRIIVLREDVSRKIAAGEVIDRPFSVVRELLDNSLDAGSKTIDLYLYGGGIREIRIVDDGSGMNNEDLKICCRRHTTSKIVEEDDLYKTDTLGFRGEALASIATCSRLEIISFAEDSNHANRLVVHGGKLVSLEEHAGKRGTSVLVSDLFFNMPARRRFLKSTSSETYMCRSIFADRALPFTGVAFRMFIEDKMRYFFPVQELKERVCAAYKDAVKPSLLALLDTETEDFKLKIVMGDPALARKDRKFIQIFVNGRRVSDYSLMQAVEYAYTGFVPGGYHPVCFVFLNVNPELVDFNIHPAKKEVKLKNISSLRQGIIGLITKHLNIPLYQGVSPAPGRITDQDNLFKVFKKSSGTWERTGSDSLFTGRMQPEEYPPPSVDEDIKYFGQVFGLFLIVRKGNTVLLIDQHAAHERIIFDELMEKQYSSQKLLIPIDFSADRVEAAVIERNLPVLIELGVELKRKENGRYIIESMPEDFLILEAEEVVRFIKEDQGDQNRVKREIMDALACRLAVKDGDRLDDITAVELLRKALQLKDPKCPHGRPIWFSVSKDDLLKFVKRK
ncbi:MAG: DNA mismatch repair endonuclease MutL [Spirochaetes bacterium]|nr:DNA mismatch repair endonuclease MutL [Spirochaetota bacterium]